MTITTLYQAEVYFRTANGQQREKATVLVVAADERDVRRKLAAMGIASEAVPGRDTGIFSGDPVYSDDVIDVATGRIETIKYVEAQRARKRRGFISVLMGGR